jgi:hypothetical protein
MLIDPEEIEKALRPVFEKSLDISIGCDWLVI